jgi:predicted metal-binding membrane protein
MIKLDPIMLQPRDALAAARSPEAAMTTDSTTTTVLETILRRDRLVVLAGIGTVVAVSWAWLAIGAGTGMGLLAMTSGSDMAGMVMTLAVWAPGYVALMFAMWWVMMAAMMLPSAAPILLLFARLNRNACGNRPYAPTGIFALGYLAAWGLFSAGATLLQWGLERAGLFSPMMTTTSWRLGAAIVIAAGLWQITPLKNVCLRHCRSPLGFLMQGWRPGWLGAFRMGAEHGAFCLGCCWFLMALLFFGGVMNLFWIAGLALYVLIEKTIPLGDWIGRVGGFALAAWGIWLLVAAPSTDALAATSDLRVEVVETRSDGPGRTILAVRLARQADNRLLGGAVVVKATTDMMPDGMPEMSGRVAPMPDDHSGIQRFMIETGMAGRWRLLLDERLPGVSAPLSGSVEYDVKS